MTITIRYYNNFSHACPSWTRQRCDFCEEYDGYDLAKWACEAHHDLALAWQRRAVMRWALGT